MTAPLGNLDAESRRLLWRCRRGMKELDILLERYVRGYLVKASPEDRATLTNLLELPDPLLADYLFGHIPVSDPPMARLVAAIRTHRVTAGPHPVRPLTTRSNNICESHEL